MNVILNVDEIFTKELAKRKNVSFPIGVQDADVILLEWNPKTSMNLIKSELQKKKTFVVFDRYLSMGVEDANWLRKQNVILTEPALNFRRKHFHYMPNWVKVKTLDDIQLNETERSIGLAYKGEIRGKMKSFSDYYIPYAKEWPKSVYTENQKEVSYSESIGIISKDNISYKDVKVTIIMGSPLDYEIGYLDWNFFSALDNNCIPLIVAEHKYFTSLTDNVKTTFDINYIVSNYDASYIGDILNTYQKIQKYYPEMMVESVVDQFLELVK